MRFGVGGLCALFILAIPQAMTGCSSVSYLPAAQAKVLLSDQIRIGTERAEVINQLGEPEKQETRGATEFLFYRVGWPFGDEAVYRNPIAIVDGKVACFGRVYYDNLNKPQTGTQIQSGCTKKP